ncbi:DUF835 domain-containing protein [Thermococcus henrietii]|uniref:DUF835 domain-containing protein n=1 Tax=Thermococcus henrietii TaxID=2016361 RepID=UPI000C0744E5|nr:DUF835 domain-containing protein [Thermococcus henrietii]
MSIPRSNLIPYLNFISRWVLFVAVAYKAHETRDKGWVLISTAFFIDAIGIEDYILAPLGVHINPQAYVIAAKIPNFFFGILIIWGAFHLKYGKTDFRHTVYISILAVASYIWLFLLATDVFKSPTERSILPSLVLGGSLVYLGWVLDKYVISRGTPEALFPWGLILLGTLNLTYPVTRFINWFAPIGFFLGGIFRLMAAVGAVKFVFYPVTPVKTEGKHPPQKGVFLFRSRGEAFRKLGKLWSMPGTVVITREDLRTLKSSLNSETLVFWVTRAKEGKLEEKPQIYAISPTKIEILTDLIARALAQGYKTIYVEAFEYLMLENGFENAVKFLLNLKDRVVSDGGTLVLVINPEALEERQKRIIEREFEELS